MMKLTYFLILTALLLTFSCKEKGHEMPEYPKILPLSDSIWGDLYLDCNFNPLKNEMVVIQRRTKLSWYSNSSDPLASSDTFYTDNLGNFRCTYHYDVSYSGPGGQPSKYGFFMYLPNISPKVQHFWDGANLKNLQKHLEFVLHDSVNIKVNLLNQHTYTSNDTLYYKLSSDTTYSYKVGNFSNGLLFSRKFSQTNCSSEYIPSSNSKIYYEIGWNSFNYNPKIIDINHNRCTAIDTATIVLSQ